MTGRHERGERTPSAPPASIAATPIRLAPLAPLAPLAAFALLAHCTPPARYEQPSGVRAYELLVTRTDSLGQGIADGLKRRGFTVRRRVRGGSRPAAYLLLFTFRDTDPPQLTWLEARLADTRTGAIVAAASVPLDSVGPSAAERARVLVDSLAAQIDGRRP